MKNPASLVMRATLLVLGFAVSGCGVQKAYDGSAPGGTALILAHGVNLVEVNGKEIGINTAEVEVLPGPAVIRLKMDRSNYNFGDNEKIYRIDLPAEAGREYVITGRRGTGMLCAFPRDLRGAIDLGNPAACITKDH